MSAALITRKTLALTLAYAMILGGVLGASKTLSFDSALELCRPGAAADASPGTPAEKHVASECCQALCGMAAAVLPPEAEVAALAWSVAEISAMPSARLDLRNNSIFLPARAPPIG